MTQRPTNRLHRDADLDRPLTCTRKLDQLCAAGGVRRDMVEVRSGFFKAGLEVVFRVLEAGRDML
ncbi:MAG: hypothetical protein ACRDOI_21800 [Trebonia sp.]